jgi:predicted Zn-dependent protease
MIGVIRVLKAQEQWELQKAKAEDREPRVYHGLFATHPDNDLRLQEVVGEAKALLDDSVPPKVGREEYLAHLEGLVFGHSADQGVLRGRHFYHGDLGVGVSFPAGWRVKNMPDRLVARPPDNDALLQITLEDMNRRMSPREFMTRRLKLDDLESDEAIQVNGLAGHTGFARAGTPWGRRTTRFSVVLHDDKAYIFASAVKDDDNPRRYEGDLVDTVLSFHPLTAEEREMARPLEIRVSRAGPETRFLDLARESRAHPDPEAQLRLLNGYYPKGEPENDEPLKLLE